LSIVLIVGALHRGAFVHGFEVSSKTRWMDAQVNLALVFSMAAWFTARETGFWKKAGSMYFPFLFATLILVIVCNHRSVWLASAGIIACLTLFRLISIGKAVFVAGMTINILAADVNLIDFISTRMTAFTSYENDPTANWRFQLWSATIEEASSTLFLGKGLGNYFQLTLSDGRVVTSILHNIYVQIGYQLGLFGLTLYVFVIASIFRTLVRAYRHAIDVHTHTLSLYAIGALFGGSLFYVAYGFDPFTWAFVGVGLAAALTQVESKARADKWTRKGNPSERPATWRVHRSLDSQAGTVSPRGRQPISWQVESRRTT
jgi:O-antigen ligase